MKQHILFTSLLTAIPLGLMAQPEAMPLSQSYWKSAEFVKAFNGSYRTNARIEPYITSEEKVVLQQVQSQMAKGARTAAIQTIQASPLSNGSAALQFNLASLYFEEGDFEQARAAYQHALKRYPSFRRAHKNLGLTLMRLDQQALAMQSLLKAVELGDMSASTLGVLGYCHLEAENYGSAFQAYQLAQLTEPNNISWKAGVAQCLMAMDKLSEGLAMIEEVYKEAPQELGYAQLYVHALLEDEQHAKAIAMLELLLRQERLSLADRSLLAQLYAGEGDFRMAKPHIAAVLENFQSSEAKTQAADAHALLQVIGAVVVLGEWQYALDALDHVAGRFDALAESQGQQMTRYRAFCMAQLGMPEALPLLDGLLKSKPLDGELILLTAKLQVSLGHAAAAEVLYERAEQLESSRYHALLSHGGLLVQQKRYKRALGKYEAAQAMKATEEQAKYIDELRRVVGLQ
ncbi:tetratricopeptide repeat protein [Rubritalea marina]|uniref:tetratricopeptide repeat protein n=1 Tax=Rubritalea marina TaxID=361055 RepID=UPI00036B64B7|nr:tetratricopeptide repeat protein [Rubritalea marina]